MLLQCSIEKFAIGCAGAHSLINYPIQFNLPVTGMSLVTFLTKL